MGSIQRHRRGYRAQVYVAGKRASKVCRTRAEASAWVVQQESELSGEALPERTFGDACRRFAREVSPTHEGERWEILRLNALQKDPLARIKLAGLQPSDLADWRDARLKDRKPGTVLREMNLIGSVLEVARRDWGWIRVNPLKDVRRPTPPKGRARRIAQDECAAICEAFGVSGGLPHSTTRERVGLAFLFALETACRSGEICALTWPDVELERRFIRLPKTKNGDSREVPLSTRAVEILKALPVTDGPVFGLDDSVRDTIWRKHRPAALKGIHFHDTRGEAIWRLSKKLDILQLARMIGHRDPRSLLIYYRESAEDMATRLD